MFGVQTNFSKFVSIRDQKASLLQTWNCCSEDFSNNQNTLS